MHQVDDAIVRDGRLILSNLPFSEGQHVRVEVAETEAEQPKTNSIQEVRRLLKGGVERFDDPFEPRVPPGDWQMLK
ncbi:MAG TPA: hypothetical protein VGI81_08260 [Tepidisphaeraceae bacterium]